MQEFLNFKIAVGPESTGFLVPKIQSKRKNKIKKMVKKKDRKRKKRWRERRQKIKYSLSHLPP